jgi:hypothetical protein
VYDHEPATAVDVASPSPVPDNSRLEQEATRHNPIEGYEDVDLDMLSDMELTQHVCQDERWPITILTDIGPIEMDEPTFQVYDHFVSHQDKWFSADDRTFALLMLFKMEEPPIA